MKNDNKLIRVEGVRENRQLFGGEEGKMEEPIRKERSGCYGEEDGE